MTDLLFALARAIAAVLQVLIGTGLLICATLSVLLIAALLWGAIRHTRPRKGD